MLRPLDMAFGHLNEVPPHWASNMLSPPEFRRRAAEPISGQLQAVDRADHIADLGKRRRGLSVAASNYARSEKSMIVRVKL
jgi:hypothetical protein